MRIEKNKKRWVTIAIHVLVWLMIFQFPYIFSADTNRGSHNQDREQMSFLYLNTALNAFWVALFYLNAGLLIPQLVYKRKMFLYVVILTSVFGIVILADDMLFHILAISHLFNLYGSMVHNFIPLVFTVAVSSAFKAISDKARADALIREKESENLKTELSFLRSQISPHFLFNVLNNITALARIKSDELEPTVMKLSSLMRYMLYETDEDKMVIKNEAEYLQDYIDLQKQRFGDELTLLVLFDIKEEWYTIEPMLLIPFVENAFKHGGGIVQHPEITIYLNVDDNALHFTVKNKFQEREVINDKTSGIGLANMKRRLQLLYPGKHTLTLDKKDGWFIASLKLNLK
jgi:two-component system LytT family sensor kinase